jgi:formate dehydrogenase iron-sulfur subunit
MNRTEQTVRRKAMLVDITKCVGCGACQAACKMENKLPEESEDKLSPTAWTALDVHGETYVRRMCQHCEHPTCVSVCPVGAFTKHPEGPVTYDADKCMGCRYCIQACPFDVPRYEWASRAPRVQKCRFCVDRQKQGLPPACAEACPTGATMYGDRDEIIAEAKARIAADPGAYVPRIYGLDEAGGTSVLYLSAVPFEQLGFKSNLPKTPLPVLTESVLHTLPGVVTLGGVFLAGVYWITNRRSEVQRLERALADAESRRPDAPRREGEEG